MAGDTELGRAVVPIRATLDELDKDLAGARGKMQGALGGIAKGVGVALGGIVGAGGAAVGIFGKMAMDAAPLEGIQASFEGITEDAETMLEALREGSAGMATDAELMRTYNEAAQLVGTTFAEQLPDAMGPLGKVAASTGADMGFMIDSLVKGIGRLSPAILDNLGIQVNLADAVARAAEMYGVEEAALTKAQTQAGMMSIAMEALEENTAAMPDVADNAATKMAQFETTMANLKAEIGMAFLPILGEVMGVFGELATEYGPMVADVFGRLAEMLGPLLGSALETLIPLIMSLLDIIIPLAETLLTNLFPAFSAILEAVVGLAVALLSGLAPVLTAIQEALMPVVIMLAEMLAPIIGEIISGLLPVLVPLLQMVARMFGRLLAALLPVIGELLGALVPVLLEIINALLPPFISVLEVLLDVFIEYIELWLPVFADLLLALIGPVGDLAILLAEGLGKALEFLAGLIETVVQPIMDWWIRTILNPIIDIVARIEIGIRSVTDWLKGLADTVRSLDLPGWMTPGSPTPLELGLRGIAKELAHVDRLMGGLNTSMTMQAVPAAGGRGGYWSGDINIYGVRDPNAVVAAVLTALRDRGMITGTALR